MNRFTREHYERFWTSEIERLHHTGRDEMRGSCPVHGGDSPDTLLVHLDTGFAHCFKCHQDGEAWSMVDFVRVRYGMDADNAHRYVYEAIGITARTATVAWTLPFLKPLTITDLDWSLGLLAERIGTMEQRFNQKEPGWKFTALYPYEDCKGVKLRCQHPEKGKRMIWLALTDKNGWSLLSKTGRKAGLYRAGTLQGQETVWLLNGEKAVDRAVRDWSLIATCAPNGEAHWKTEYTGELTRAGVKRVFLPPDNDETGGEHARLIGGELMRAGIETRIVTLPDLPPKGDLWDFMEAGGTRAGAEELARASPLADAGYVRPKKEHVSSDQANTAMRRAQGSSNGDGAPGPGAPDLITGYHANDTDNARRMLVVANGNLAYNERAEEPWFVYDGARWKNSGKTRLFPYAARAMELLGQQGNERGEERVWKYAQSKLNVGGIHAMIELASAPARVELDDFDRQPWLLNCPTGTYDAAKDEWREHRREDRITRVFSYDYDPALPAPQLFLRSLWEWLGGTADAADGELEKIERQIAYVRRWLAYLVTGLTEEKAFLVVHGERGNNGKTTFLSTVQSALGEYAITIAASSLTRGFFKNTNNVMADIARSRGARAIFAGEPPSGEKFDQATIKLLTQGEVRVSAVFKGKQPFQFLPTAKIVLETNKVPTFDTEDRAFMKRMHLLHFAHEFAPPSGGVRELRERLRDEEPAIFTWIVDGIKELRELGLARPGESAEELKELRDEQARNDGEEPFLEHCFDFGPRLWCRVSVISELRLKFGQQFGLRPIQANQLSRKLTERRDITRGNDYARDHRTPAWLRGLAPKSGMLTATVGSVLWGYDAAVPEGEAAAVPADGGEAEQDRKEAEDAYWHKWPRN